MSSVAFIQVDTLCMRECARVCIFCGDALFCAVPRTTASSSASIPVASWSKERVRITPLLVTFGVEALSAAVTTVCDAVGVKRATVATASSQQSKVPTPSPATRRSMWEVCVTCFSSVNVASVVLRCIVLRCVHTVTHAIPARRVARRLHYFVVQRHRGVVKGGGDGSGGAVGQEEEGGGKEGEGLEHCQRGALLEGTWEKGCCDSLFSGITFESA